MSMLIGFGIMVYSVWRAIVNYLLFDAANKQYGSDWMWPAGTPNYGLRIWLWIGAAVVGALMSGFFEGGGGCGSRGNPCL